MWRELCLPPIKAGKNRKNLIVLLCARDFHFSAQHLGSGLISRLFYKTADLVSCHLKLFKSSSLKAWAQVSPDTLPFCSQTIERFVCLYKSNKTFNRDATVTWQENYEQVSYRSEGMLLEIRHWYVCRHESFLTRLLSSRQTSFWGHSFICVVLWVEPTRTHTSGTWMKLTAGTSNRLFAFVLRCALLPTRPPYT